MHPPASLRRDKTALQRHALERVRLLEAALGVAAGHSIDGDSATRVAAAAGVTPSALAKHFAGPHQLWQALADALSNELLLAIESTAGEFVDPAKRIGCGVRLYLHEAHDNPLFARLAAHRGLDLASATSLIHRHVPPHIDSGTHSARFADLTAEVAIDVIAGATLAALARIAEGHAAAEHPESVALAILKALGVPAVQARKLARIELPRLGANEGGLLARSRAIQKKGLHAEAGAP